MRRVGVALVLLATCVVYAGTVDFGFVYDDQPQIVANPFLRSWRYFGRYFERDVWSQAGRGQGSNYYRPLFMVWLRLNDAVWGLKPIGWHLAVVLLHVGVTWLVYRLALRLFRDWRPAAAAALFGLNPLHVEAVAWVSGATDPLVTALVLASFLCFLNSRAVAPPGLPPDGIANERPAGIPESGGNDRSSQLRRWAWTAGSWWFYLLATMAKETAPALPLCIAAYAWIETGAGSASRPKRLKAAFGAALPYLLLTLLYLALRLRALGRLLHPLAPMPWRYLFLTLPSVLWFYLRLLVWPAPLSIYYGARWVRHPTLVNFWLPLAALGLVAVGLAGVSRRRPVAALATAWMLLFLAPVLDLRVFSAENFLQDRYLYLPSVGFAMLAVELLTRFLPSRSSAARLSRAATALIVAAVVAYGAATLVESTYWADDTLLFYQALRVAPDSPYPKTQLAYVMMRRKHYGRAAGLFHAAIAEDPGFGYPWKGLAILHFETGDYPKAIQYAEQFLRLYPDTPDGYYILGLSYYQLARWRPAAQYLGYALALNPYADGYHYALGMALMKGGQLGQALAEFRAEPRSSAQRADADRQIAAVREALRSRASPPATAP